MQYGALLLLVHRVRRMLTAAHTLKSNKIRAKNEIHVNKTERHGYFEVHEQRTHVRSRNLLQCCCLYGVVLAFPHSSFVWSSIASFSVQSSRVHAGKEKIQSTASLFRP